MKNIKKQDWEVTLKQRRVTSPFLTELEGYDFSLAESDDIYPYVIFLANYEHNPLSARVMEEKIVEILSHEVMHNVLSVIGEKCASSDLDINNGQVTKIDESGIAR